MIDKIQVLSKSSVTNLMNIILNFLQDFKSFKFNLETISKEKIFDKYKLAYKTILIENYLIN
jgi:hypothetical protein